LVTALLILVPSHGALGAAIGAVLASAVSLIMGAFWLRPAFGKGTWVTASGEARSAGENYAAHRPR